ncbi:uncharacterized protein FIBRA_05203 [Fibroporia radiculosa]|uniref:Uncharacterized protein n=1 Tax=Fibroporia radiculosa TaxID=599839 RepID=J4G8T0_9APHY|nr:uncharacterized protein FIBRA_05203 [Fibroporia radiculosa]CCM03083.1 predicted protein [Fibroporia radiculosa]
MSMIPRFANPHSLADSLEPTTRKVIEQENTAVANSEQSGEQTGVLVELERLVKRSIGDIYLNPTEDPSIVSQKKRRKTQNNVSDSHPEDSLPFRLISRSLPPGLVLLDVPPPPVILVNEPPCEDDDEEADRRRARAAATAVNFDWIIQESRVPVSPRNCTQKKVTNVAGDLPVPHPTLMVVGLVKPPPATSRLALSLPADFALSSPHELPSEGVGCPLVDVAIQQESTTPAKRRWRRSRSARQRPPATFWRPLQEWGPRASGYAMGYEGSWAVSHDDPQRYKYQRDTMRKGAVSSWDNSYLTDAYRAK